MHHCGTGNRNFAGLVFSMWKGRAPSSYDEAKLGAKEFEHRMPFYEARRTPIADRVRTPVYVIARDPFTRLASYYLDKDTETYDNVKFRRYFWNPETQATLSRPPGAAWSRDVLHTNLTEREKEREKVRLSPDDPAVFEAWVRKLYGATGGNGSKLCGYDHHLCTQSRLCLWAQQRRTQV